MRSTHALNAIKLPDFAVIGNQSSGKTTLLQTISSELHQFLSLS